MKKISYREFLKWKNNLKIEDKVLDVGCWDGENTLRLNKICDAWGIDINTDRFKKVNKSIKAKVLYGDVTKEIPLKIKFDYILLSEVLEHLSDEDSAIKNISNALKTGGKLILSTPNKIPFFDFWDPAWIRWKLGFGQRHQHYNIYKLTKKLEKNRLIVKRYAIGWGFNFLIVRWINVLLEYLLRTNKIEGTRPGDGYFDLCIIAEKIK